MSGAKMKSWKLVASALVALLASGTTGAPRALAQTPAAAQPAALTPPRVTKFVDAKRPETTPAEGRGDRAGADDRRRRHADRREGGRSAGAALDAAALEAVRQFTFEPRARATSPCRRASAIATLRTCRARRRPPRRRWRGRGAATPPRPPQRPRAPAVWRVASSSRAGDKAVAAATVTLLSDRAPPSARRWPPRTARSRSPTSPPARTGCASRRTASPASRRPRR